MGSLVYLSVIALQIANSLATDNNEIPMRCFFHNENLFNSFKSLVIVPLKMNEDGWVLNVDNVKFLGMDDAVLDNIGLNFVTKHAQISFHTDMLVTYNYKSNGTLFSQPIFGEGFTEVPIKNIHIALDMPFNIVEKAGQTYVELEKFDISYNIRGNAQFKFSNLYAGDKELSDPMHALMNENWRYLTTVFGKFFFAEFGVNIFNIFKNYAANIPLKNVLTC